MPNMAATVTAIYRYPVKGLSAEKLGRVALMPGECLPHDRRFAIALGSTPFDPDRPVWLSKTHFIMLMRDEKLAQLRTRFDGESGILAIVEDGQALLRARLTEPQGCRLIAEFFESFLGDAVHRPLRVVAAPGHAFADARHKPNATTDQYVSLINRASIAALEDAMAVPVDPIRFRANVYFDGAAAWSEHDWIDTEIILGHARLRVISPITRCAATRSIPSPLSEISTSSQPSVVRSAISIWGSTPRWWRVAKSRSAMRCLGCPGRNEAIGCLAGGSAIVALAGATGRAMTSCPQPARTSVGR